MSDPFVAEIRMVGFNFAPRGWATCNGQILPISQNTALFSLLGTTYGGDGKSTFALPNLMGSTPIGAGQGAGLSQRFLGESGGSANVTLIQSEMPLHNHGMMAYTGDAGDSRTPNPSAAIALTTPGNLFSSTTTGLNAMSPQAAAVTGGSQPHNNMMPYLTVVFIIALQGVFPPRG
jgi:microcystin-dependent protein